MPADQSSPTRVFATLSGVLLVIGGTLGFFHSSTFGTPGEIEDALGFAVNGWINTLHIVVGALGLLAAGYAARAYSLAVAVLFGVMAIWGFALGSDEALLDRFPADEAQNLLHAALAILGLAAWLAERPKREPKPRKERPSRIRSPEDDRRKREEKRREKKEREEKNRREKKEREARKREEKAKREPKKPARPADRNQRRSGSGDDPASPGDEPRTEPERPSRRRRRPRRPSA